MSYKEQLYRNALKAVATIYEKSKYDPNVDLYRSFDIINSVNDNQIASKEWLIKELLPYINLNSGDICILGGWYGLTALMLAQHVSKNLRIDSVDIDPQARIIGKQLVEGYKNIRFHADSAEDWFFNSYPKRYQLIINTSCEHMEQEDIELMLAMKQKDAIVCLQSNNYHSVQSHINTYDSLDDFVDSLNLNQIFFKQMLPSPEGNYERYMVIGK